MCLLVPAVLCHLCEVGNRDLGFGGVSPRIVPGTVHGLDYGLNVYGLNVAILPRIPNPGSRPLVMPNGSAGGRRPELVTTTPVRIVAPPSRSQTVIVSPSSNQAER